jgi:hypothetical protein
MRSLQSNMCTGTVHSQVHAVAVRWQQSTLPAVSLGLLWPCYKALQVTNQNVNIEQPISSSADRQPAPAQQDAAAVGGGKRISVWDRLEKVSTEDGQLADVVSYTTACICQQEMVCQLGSC